MLANKNKTISTFKNIFRNPFVLRKIKFDIHPLYSLVMLLGMTLCIVLGVWQYQKSLRYVEPPQAPSIIKGHFLNEHTFLLDNKSVNGKVGYAVITPFQTYDRIFLVNRGFVAYKSRNVVPEIPPVLGHQTIVGTKSFYELPVLLNQSLQDPIKERVQFIDTKSLSKKLNSDIRPETFDQQYGAGVLTSFPKTEPYINEHRHLGYAIQWWILAIIAAVIWSISSVKRELIEC